MRNPSSASAPVEMHGPSTRWSNTPTSTSSTAVRRRGVVGWIPPNLGGKQFLARPVAAEDIRVDGTITGIRDNVKRRHLASPASGTELPVAPRDALT